MPFVVPNPLSQGATMTVKEYKRKLVAIISADVKGYSRLMGEDEASTVSAITDYRGLFCEIMQQHHGRVVDAIGDNILAEFASVVDALKGAWEVQNAFAERNAELPEHRRMQFRIGLNVGDVIEDEGRLYGDGVNVAARLESLADAGGILVSGTVYDQVKHKLPYRFDYIGDQQVKNIQDPIPAYRVVMESTGGPVSHAPSPVMRKRPKASAIVLAIGLIAVLGFGAYFWIGMHAKSLTEGPPAGKFQAQPYSQKASIAVLPFSNLNSGQEQDYFTDGITNDLITALSKFRELLVISSNTVFTYKGGPVKIKEIGQALGVRYIIEGSIQKVSGKVRVNAQLIDATTGFHIWSERYNREITDLFVVQDEIVHAIVGKLAVQIDAAERERAMRKDTQNLEAYDFLLHGLEYHRRRTRADSRKARQMFEKAIELDPDYALAYVGLGNYYRRLVEYGWTEFPSQALQRSEELALKALDLDESEAEAYTLLGNVHIYAQRYDRAISQLDRAIALNPNDAFSYRMRGQVLLWSGRIEEAIQSLETSRRFDPNMQTGLPMFLGIAYYLRGQYDKAVDVLEEGLSRRPDWAGNHILLAAVYAETGRTEDARREAQEVMRLQPFFKIDQYGTVFRNQADRERIIQGLRKAGLK